MSNKIEAGCAAMLDADNLLNLARELEAGWERPDPADGNSVSNQRRALIYRVVATLLSLAERGCMTPDKEISQEAARAMLAALRRVHNEGCRTCYAGDHDEAGEHGCCGGLSYRNHAPDCWTLDVAAAIALAERGA